MIQKGTVKMYLFILCGIYQATLRNDDADYVTKKDKEFVRGMKNDKTNGSSKDNTIMDRNKEIDNINMTYETKNSAHSGMARTLKPSARKEIFGDQSSVTQMSNIESDSNVIKFENDSGNQIKNKTILLDKRHLYENKTEMIDDGTNKPETQTHTQDQHLKNSFNSNLDTENPDNIFNLARETKSTVLGELQALQDTEETSDEYLEDAEENNETSIIETAHGVNTAETMGDEIDEMNLNYTINNQFMVHFCISNNIICLLTGRFIKPYRMFICTGFLQGTVKWALVQLTLVCLDV